MPRSLTGRIAGHTWTIFEGSLQRFYLGRTHRNAPKYRVESRGFGIARSKTAPIETDDQTCLRGCDGLRQTGCDRQLVQAIANWLVPKDGE